MLELTVNGRAHSVDVEPEMPLLWVLRDHLNLTGVKYGCGISLCGACTVHIDGEPMRSCVVPVSAVAGKAIVTIEGLSTGGLHRIQQAWIDHEVPQCGYCQTGMIMSAAALLAKTPAPTDADIDREMTNLCRCGTYARVRKAIHALAGSPASGSVGDEEGHKAKNGTQAAGGATGGRQ
jgi:aerobic-type carbon monoxide dehydrogenase small subunit (CoxS/CutS family)